MKTYKIVIAGTGGIGIATVVLLSKHIPKGLSFFLGNRHKEKAENICTRLNSAFPHTTYVPFHLPENGINDATKAVLNKSDILLDCLPGNQAIRMAQFALDFDLHYANLTEHVEASNQIKAMAKGASKGFILQTGLAPGFINILGHYLYDQFLSQYHSQKISSLLLRVGALTQHAVGPHFYGFTWSPIGVATEYIEEAVCIRDYKKVTLPSLSQRESIILNGTAYEAELTSGGTADLPDFFSGKIEHLDYKTLRYPGHYDWVKMNIKRNLSKSEQITALQEIMLREIPHVEADEIVIYVAIRGLDSNGNFRHIDKYYQILPRKIQGFPLRAIQVTTAAPLAQCALLLSENKFHGIVLQSQLDPDEFLKGEIMREVLNAGHS